MQIHSSDSRTKILRFRIRGEYIKFTEWFHKSHRSETMLKTRREKTVDSEGRCR